MVNRHLTARGQAVCVINSMRRPSSSLQILLSAVRFFPVLVQLSKASELCYSKGSNCEGTDLGEQNNSGEKQSYEHTVGPVGMEWRSHGKDNQDLISQLKGFGIIKSTEVEQAMRRVDRGNYCARSPYMDSPQSIGFGVTISAPHMHAHALEILKDNIKEGSKVLDVGSGT